MLVQGFLVVGVEAEKKMGLVSFRMLNKAPLAHYWVTYEQQSVLLHFPLSYTAKTKYQDQVNVAIC